MSTRLIKYEETPQVSAIEYSERFKMERDPKLRSKYEALSAQRSMGDLVTQKEVGKQQKGYRKKRR